MEHVGSMMFVVATLALTVAVLAGMAPLLVGFARLRLRAAKTTESLSRSPAPQKSR